MFYIKKTANTSWCTLFQLNVGNRVTPPKSVAGYLLLRMPCGCAVNPWRGLFENDVEWVRMRGVHYSDTMPKRTGRGEGTVAALCRSCAVAGAQRSSLAGLAAGQEQLAHHVHALCAVDQKQGLGVVTGRRAGPRRGLGHPLVGPDRRPSPSARGRGTKRNGADPALGRSHGGLSTKRHLFTNALGRAVRALPTVGSVHDRTLSEQIRERFAVHLPTCRPRGQVSRARLTWPVFPSSRQRDDTAYTPVRYGHDVNCYRQRNAIERTFVQRK